MLTVDDIRGVYVLPPTPALSDCDWDAAQTVDLDEARRMTGLLLQPGVTGLGLFGTTGEGATLLWEEKQACAGAVVEAVAGRAQIWAGATALGTREVVRQMRGLRDVGVDGALVGLPLWQTPTVENAVGFFADLSEAVPDLPVMVYSNSWFFKFDFPPEFWAGVAAKAPTVIASKSTHGFAHYQEEIAAVAGRINLMPGEFGVPIALRAAPGYVTAIWSTQAALGPEPTVALMAAIDSGDCERIAAVAADLASVPPYVPDGAMARRDLTDGFAKYNVQVAKYRLNVSGLISAGPPRSPYVDLPEDWKRQVEQEVVAYAELRRRYGASRRARVGEPPRGRAELNE
jgi:dihydrodipicolinate synthase/N-acetylneuraminate lyase